MTSTQPEAQTQSQSDAQSETQPDAQTDAKHNHDPNPTLPPPPLRRLPLPRFLGAGKPTIAPLLPAPPSSPRSYFSLCRSLVPLVQGLLAFGKYTATFAGSEQYLPSSGTGTLIKVLTLKIF